MEQTRVVEWIDIAAPVDEVYQIVLDLQRRLQLSPLWDYVRIEKIIGDYPEVGSRYKLRLVQAEREPVYTTTIVEHNHRRKFAYQLNIDRQTEVVWRFMEIACGTRVIYEEQFLKKDKDGDNFVESVRTVVRQSMQNLKNYAEFRGTRWHAFVRSGLIDRFYLGMRRDQRKTVVAILFLHGVGLISFIMAAVAIGIGFFLG